MKVLIIMGTRPEAIKFAPLIRKMSSDSFFDLRVCLTGQHREMLHQVIQFFKIPVDYDLSLMKKNQSLNTLSSEILTALGPIINEFNPDLVFVQGDTTTAFMGALAAFYNKTAIAHLEAGLRSGNKYEPFPEEANRKLISAIADYHFAPTPFSDEALKKEGLTDHVWVVGNTVVDALLLGLDTLRTESIDFSDEFSYIDFSKRIILLTAHRRENFGKPFEDICDAIIETSTSHPDVQIIYPVHLNPNVQEIVHRKLSNRKNIFLIDPLDYPRLIWIMNKSYLIITDSGGIQEEAPAIGKPVLVLRNVTERMEGVTAGTAKLVGTNARLISDGITGLLMNEDGIYDQMSQKANPYGDGTTSKQIVSILKSLF